MVKAYFCSTLIILSLFSFSAFGRDDAGATVSSSITYNPPAGKNGYVAEIPYSYVFRNCYNELYVNIARKKTTASKYMYKGKPYWPGAFNKSSFDKVSVSGVTLFADVNDRGQRIGNIKMSNLTMDNGAGCFGQTYNVGKLVGIDGKAAAKRPKDFTLSNIRLETSGSSDYALDSILSKQAAAQEKTAQKESKEAEAAAAVATAGATATVPGAAKAGTNAKANGQKAGTTTAGKATPPQPSAAEKAAQETELKRQKIKQDLEVFNKQQNAKMKQVDRDTKAAAKKIGSAASNFYSGWQGSGSAIGISIRMSTETLEEQDPTWIGMLFGKYWNPLDPRTEKKWISGFESEFAFNSDWLGADDYKAFYSIRDKNWYRYNWGFFLNFIGNITTLGVVQPVLSIGWVEKEEFDTFDSQVNSENIFVTDYGIAVNIDGALVFKMTYSSEMKLGMFSVGLMSN